MTQAEPLPHFKELRLVAPVDGVVTRLEDLPDAVFAQKMLGDGIAIDPTSTRVVSPCSGVVTNLHRALHALTLRSDEGVNILVHVGLDTVMLGGKGFTALVKEGDRISAGQPLLDFDLDIIAQGALSAQVEVVITEGGDNVTFKRHQGTVQAGADEILRISLEPLSEVRPKGADTQAHIIEKTATIENQHGLHARPAARLTQVVQAFSATVSLSYNNATASARSVTGILGLDLGHGAVVRIIAEGIDAEDAAQAVKDAISSGLGEDKSATAAPEVAKWEPDEEGAMGGIPASPGLAYGTIVVRSFELPQYEKRSENPSLEKARLRSAVETVKAELLKQAAAYRDAGEQDKAQIFAAHGEILSDQSVLLHAEKSIESGASAAQGWQDALGIQIEKFGSLRSPVLRQRASDMKDVARRVLFAILSKPLPGLTLSAESILVCDDLTPSAAAELERGKVSGIITEMGGATSHAAIIARSMGVPYVAGVGSDVARLKDGLPVILDGDKGAIFVEPSDSLIKKAGERIAAQEKQREESLKKADEKAQTIDGYPVEVGANIGSQKEAAEAVSNGCDGVGLLRSEFLFLGRRQAPSEAEQQIEYEGIGRALGKERSLVIRTLDVGGDKPLSYMPLEAEENPFLGIRGLRLSFKFPDLFRAQIRAALAAARHTKLNIMFPMVAQPAELTKARAFVTEEMRQLSIPPDSVAIGVMVEVPSAALNARWLAKEADFFSIGTNDLTQYTLAMDRGHPDLATQADAFDPAVLRLIKMTADAAHAEGKWVGVCGSLAAERLATPLLIGLDIDELSVPAPEVPTLKARIRSLRHAHCQAVAEGALALPSSTHVRELLTSFLQTQSDS